MVLLSLLIWGFSVGSVAALTVQAVADRDRVAVGESLQLQLRLDGSPDGEPDFTPLQQNWEILSRSQSSQMQIVGSSFKRSVVYNLTLMPRGQGRLLIPALCFAQDCSLPLPIEVSNSSALGSSTSEPLLLETEISAPQIVTLGQLLLKVRLLHRVDLLEGQLNEPQPTGVEALVKKLGDDRSYELRRNGQLYQVIERTYAIYPQGSGQMQIPALQFDGAIAVGSSSRFDPFARQGKRVRRTSQPLQIEVTPLPDDLGRRPWLPATSVELQEDWQQQPPQLVVGEPATRTLRLSASGLLSTQLPVLTPGVPAGFKTYPDQPSREDQVTSSGIKGVMVQKIALVPTQAGRYQLPAVELDWWDLSSGKWRKSQLAALDVLVAPATGASASSSALTPAPPLPDAAPQPSAAASLEISPTQAGDSSVAAPVPSGVWPWLSLGLALGWLLTLIYMFTLRRSTPSATEGLVADMVLTEKAARKVVVQAARRHDPQATRQALLALSRILWPAAQGGAYERLRKTADPALQDELENLDLCLYGRSGQRWDGQGLADKLANWHPATPTGKKSGLPGLYPDAPA